MTETTEGGPVDETPRRFRDALSVAREAWAAADPHRQAALAACSMDGADVVVPYFSREYRVTHPAGEVTCGAAAAHAAVAILILHYLIGADGSSDDDAWHAFRELPDGMFYATSFARRAEATLAAAFAAGEGGSLGRFRAVASAQAGEQLDLADAGYAFRALPKIRLAVLVWQGDDDFPAEARVLFSSAAARVLPAEDLAGLGEALARMLVASAR
ncbi:MAG: DUF3786 domain-containing protein [Thermoleophilia bacterium]